jgi:hypothetical protein
MRHAWQRMQSLFAAAAASPDGLFAHRMRRSSPGGLASRAPSSSGGASAPGADTSVVAQAAEVLPGVCSAAPGLHAALGIDSRTESEALSEQDQQQRRQDTAQQEEVPAEGQGQPRPSQGPCAPESGAEAGSDDPFAVLASAHTAASAVTPEATAAAAEAQGSLREPPSEATVAVPPTEAGRAPSPSLERRLPLPLPPPAPAAASRAELAAIVASHASMQATVAALATDLAGLAGAVAALQKERRGMAASVSTADALAADARRNSAQLARLEAALAEVAAAAEARRAEPGTGGRSAAAESGTGVSRQGSLQALTCQLAGLEAGLTPEAVTEMRGAMERLNAEVRALSMAVARQATSSKEQQQPTRTLPPLPPTDGETMAALAAQVHALTADMACQRAAMTEVAARLEGLVSDPMSAQGTGAAAATVAHTEALEASVAALAGEVAAGGAQDVAAAAAHKELAARVEALTAEVTARGAEAQALSEQLHQLSSQVASVNEGAADVEDVESLRDAIEKLADAVAGGEAAAAARGSEMGALRREVAALAAAMGALQAPNAAQAQPLAAGGNTDKEEERVAGEADAAAEAAVEGVAAVECNTTAGSSGGVLSAPLSLVVQLQAEVSELSRAVAELRRRSTRASEGSASAMAAAASAGGSLQQRPASAPAVPLLEAAAEAGVDDGGSGAAKANAAAGEVMETADRLAARMAAAEGRLETVTAAVEDTASRVALLSAATAAAAAAQPSGGGRGYGSSGGAAAPDGGRAFSELVPVLANLKALIEGQGAELAALKERLDAAEGSAHIVEALRDEVAARLAAAEAAATAATADSPVPLSRAAGGDRQPPRSGTSSRAISRASSVRASGEELAPPVSLPGCLPRSAGETVGTAAADGGVATAGGRLVTVGSEELAMAVAGPIGVVHRILLELKRRVEGLEASVAAVAPATAAAAPAARPGAPGTAAAADLPPRLRRAASAVSARPRVPSMSALAGEVSTLQGQVVALQRSVAALRGRAALADAVDARLAALEAAAAEAAARGSGPDDLAPRVAAQEAEVGCIAARLAALEAARAVAAEEVAGRVTELEAGLGAVVEALPLLRQQLQPVQVRHCISLLGEKARDRCGAPFNLLGVNSITPGGWGRCIGTTAAHAGPLTTYCRPHHRNASLPRSAWPRKQGPPTPAWRRG